MVVNSDKGEEVWEVTIPCTNKAEPGAGHDVAREGAHHGDGDEGGHDRGQIAEHPAIEGHGYGITAEYGSQGEDSQIKDISQHEDDGDQGQGDVNGP